MLERIAGIYGDVLNRTNNFEWQGLFTFLGKDKAHPLMILNGEHVKQSGKMDVGMFQDWGISIKSVQKKV